MHNLPRLGAAHEAAFLVEPAHTVTFADLPPVLSTPWMIWHLEFTALDLVAPTLADGWITLGTRVEIDHLAPALIGTEVLCTARLVAIDGLDLTFQVEARSDKGRLAHGLHRRRMAEVARLRQRLERDSAD